MREAYNVLGSRSLPAKAGSHTIDLFTRSSAGRESPAAQLPAEAGSHGPISSIITRAAGLQSTSSRASGTAVLRYSLSMRRREFLSTVAAVPALGLAIDAQTPRPAA